ncbi:unnamed protein product [Cylindrotheca closterium]|uniref:Uncharacterized protein n=1 Tax=Cylindrotheca closterium TaxID=2856 RepID=A0AAD2FFA0_9STRA|nr:unnamed protein product [Cylindrotheca closterium]
MDPKKGCPCCTFRLEDDLFLPPSLKSNYNGISVSSMELPMDPKEAVDFLSKASPIDTTMILIDSHGHAQLERDADENYTLDNKTTSSQGPLQLKSITCAVEPKDWADTLRYASKSTSVLPALGVHPWYLERLPNNWLEELDFWSTLPQLWHGVFVSVLKEIRDSAEAGEDVSNLLPPAIAMHSFTGTAHHVKELLALEKTIVKDNKTLFYFGFSHTVNFAMCTSEKSRRKGRDAVREVPTDRLLVESDVHASDDLLAGTAGAIAYVAWAREQELIAIASLSSQNGQSFLAMQ